MQESTRRLLLNSTVTDIETKEDYTTFYLVNEEGHDYAVEIQSGDVIVRPLREFASPDLLGELKERVARLEAQVKELLPDQS